MEMEMEMISIPYGVKSKLLSKRELDRYFTKGSLDELIFTLREYARRGYLDFEVILSPDYFKWEQAHRDVMLNADALLPIEPFFVAQRTTHGLYPPDKAKSASPLSRAEINNVIGKLPNDMAERYLQFKLTDVDREKLRSIVAPRPVVKDEDSEPLEYAGLRIDGIDVTYLGEPIRLAYKERHLLRVFLEKEGGLVYPDDLLRDPEIISDTKDYKDPRARVSKLVSAVRLKLVEKVHQPCIINENKEGWKLVIK
jgi:hypothetical protein